MSPRKLHKWKIDQLARLHLMKPIKGWDDFEFFKGGEWQVISERLDDYDRTKRMYCPERKLLFAALDEVPYDSVKVMWVAQDPYPNRSLATGIAFSVPPVVKTLPPTLLQIFKEYSDDLHYPDPSNGDLSPWCAEGVLLWNAYPSCFMGQPGSHHWPEWEFVTTEIINRLKEKKVVFVFSGNSAREFAKLVDYSKVIETSHPSPRGSRFSKQPFLGSRLFSTVNAKLVTLGQKPINWRLP